jgi:predicted nucleic acid-binding Zn ribbon protein
MKELPERYFTNKNRVVRIGQLLKEAFPKKTLVDKNCQKVMSIWSEVVGNEIYKSARITGIKNGIMYVNAESSAMIHYLTNFEKYAIIHKINNILGSKYIEDIRFKVGIAE